MGDVAEVRVLFCNFGKLLIDISVSSNTEDHVQDVFVEGMRFDEGLPQYSA